MDAVRLSDSITYIGVNDRTTALFESLWPIPAGVSYNSYLVTGADKAAIVDGVDVENAHLQIDNIRQILGDRRPDYLVINHMEPDHSGSIRALRAEWPDIVIVGNTQTLAMVKGFYEEEGNVLKVKDGDALELGADVTLRFHLTPMVHWPETMMTYHEQEHTLFSGDAFGCFGALNGDISDSEMDTDRYFPEMVRYYSNIVGKYGQFVQRALAKLSGADIRTICSTHGPVWQRRAAEVVGLYDRLSRYEPLDDGVTVLYGSMYGNTACMAEVAARALADNGVRNIDVFDAARTHLSDILAAAFRHRGLVVASPTYSDSVFPPVANALTAMAMRGLTGRKAVLLGSHTWADKSTRSMADMLAPCAPDYVADPVVARQAPASDILDAVRAAATMLATALKK